MKRYYPTLFSPIKIGTKTIARNRIETAPTLFPGISPEGYPNDAFIAYYMNKAKGGAGIVTLGETPIDWDYGKTHACQIQLRGEHAGLYLANVTDAIHKYGALANIELCHGGVFGAPELIGKNPIGPSPTVRADGVQVEEMTLEQMDNIADTFADAAQICKNCGFDMVMIHAAHGWLLGAWLSPIFNHRTDEHGGSFDNRCKYPLEVLRRVRAAVGPDFPVELRISGSELVEEGSHIEDCIAFLKKAEPLIDLAHISVGTRADIHGRGVAHPSTFLPHGCNAYLAKAVKGSGLNIPVVALGALDDPETAEGILARGEADLVSIARGGIADPEFPNKAREGRIQDITPCIRCFHCIDRSVGRTNSDAVLRFSKTSTHRFTCSVNPQIGFEHYTPEPLPTRKQRVAVIGGGPAGLEAAITAAEHGHIVTIYEKKDHLGGALDFADGVSFKTQVAKFKRHLIHRVESLNIDVNLNTEATPELIEEGSYDHVIAALGAEPILPDLPGLEYSNVILAPDAFHLMDTLGKNIVIIGGGQVGCEAGLHFAENGHHVTIVGRNPLIAPDASFTHRLPLIEQLDAHTTYLTGTTVTAIREQHIEIMTAEGKKGVLDADTVIIAVGMRARSELAESFRDTTLNFTAIGDCVKPATIQEAVKIGYDTAIAIH